MDDVDALWMCGGPNVDGVEELKCLCYNYISRYQATRPSILVSSRQCPTYYHASRINSLAFMTAIGCLSIRGSGCFHRLARAHVLRRCFHKGWIPIASSPFCCRWHVHVHVDENGQRAYSAHESQTVNPRGMVVGGTLVRRD